jgi:hypothetical protein
MRSSEVAILIKRVDNLGKGDFLGLINRLSNGQPPEKIDLRFEHDWGGD